VVMSTSAKITPGTIGSPPAFSFTLYKRRSAVQPVDIEPAISGYCRQRADRAPPPAAREHSHLFWPEMCAYAPPSAWFQRGTGDSRKEVAMTASKSLPARPSLESLRKQAKKLARDTAAGHPDAVVRVRAQVPHADLPLTQRQAQLVIAREYGYAGWQDLSAEVSKRLGKGLDGAVA